MRNFLPANSVALFDNASHQVMESTLQLIDDVFQSWWCRLPEYCPQLAPVEKGFSLVRGYVRRRSIEANSRPREVLVDAFQYYSIGGPGAAACHNLFNVYFQNRYDH
jgi:hypothetical protein